MSSPHIFAPYLSLPSLSPFPISPLTLSLPHLLPHSLPPPISPQPLSLPSLSPSSPLLSSLQTNDSSVLGAVRMENYVMVVSTGITTSTDTQLHKWMDAHFGDNLTAVEVKGEGLGVAEFRTGVLGKIFQRLGPQPLTFSGHPLHLLPAYLTWVPFTTTSEAQVGSLTSVL